MESLDLHGVKFEDAIEMIEKFIDSSFFHTPGGQIEIITGHGVIRAELIKIIGKHKLIKAHRDNGGSFVIDLES